jgi:hypothetical protein
MDDTKSREIPVRNMYIDDMDDVLSDLVLAKIYLVMNMPGVMDKFGDSSWGDKEWNQWVEKVSYGVLKYVRHETVADEEGKEEADVYTEPSGRKDFW